MEGQASLIADVFQKFDEDGDGLLNQEEASSWWAFCHGRLRSFGMAGGGEEGTRAFQLLCVRLGAEAERGLALEHVQRAYLGVAPDWVRGPLHRHFSCSGSSLGSSEEQQLVRLVPPVQQQHGQRHLNFDDLEPAAADEGSECVAVEVRRAAEDPYGEAELDSLEPKDFQIRRTCPKVRRLTETKPFVLDVSLRETTVGQTRPITPLDRLNILTEVRRCGLTEIAVGDFASRSESDESFLQLCKDSNVSFDGFWAFSELCDTWLDGQPDFGIVPRGLAKAAEFGLPGIIIQVDLAEKTGGANWEEVGVKENIGACLDHRIAWARENGFQRIMVNFRDMPIAMIQAPSRVLRLVHYLATRPEPIFGIMLEEGSGAFLPSEIAAWVDAVRTTMDKCGWIHGHCIIHARKKYGLADSTLLEAIAAGCDGIWAAVCEEGAANGHASSCVALTNLHRLGNPYVCEAYNLEYLRKAAQNITKIVSGKLPFERQEVYGDRALGDALGCDEDVAAVASCVPSNVAVGAHNSEEAVEAGEQGEYQVEIPALASPEDLKCELTKHFGEATWNDYAIARMKTIMMDDVHSDIHLDYNTASGIGTLYERAGGYLTPEMRHKILDRLEIEGFSEMQTQLFHELRGLWDGVAQEDGDDENLDWASFYEGFMGRYFSSLAAPDTQACLQVLDLAGDGVISWDELAWRACFVIREYEPEDMEGVLNGIFVRLLIPMMKSRRAIGPETRLDRRAVGDALPCSAELSSVAESSEAGGQTAKQGDIVTQASTQASPQATPVASQQASPQATPKLQTAEEASRIAPSGGHVPSIGASTSAVDPSYRSTPRVVHRLDSLPVQNSRTMSPLGARRSSAELISSPLTCVPRTISPCPRRSSSQLVSTPLACVPRTLSPSTRVATPVMPLPSVSAPYPPLAAQGTTYTSYTGSAHATLRASSVPRPTLSYVADPLLSTKQSQVEISASANRTQIVVGAQQVQGMVIRSNSRGPPARFSSGVFPVSTPVVRSPHFVPQFAVSSPALQWRTPFSATTMPVNRGQLSARF